MIIFYVAAPLPLLCAKRAEDSGFGSDGASNPCADFAFFLTTGIVVSAFGLPIVFAQAVFVS